MRAHSAVILYFMGGNMKKKISVLFAVILGLTAALTGCGKEKKEEGQLVPVTLNEVAHSVFYAPQYVAIEEGYFVKEGIKLELVTGFGADKVMAAILSGDADIGFMGSEASIYAYQQGGTGYSGEFCTADTASRKFFSCQKRNA